MEGPRGSSGQQQQPAAIAAAEEGHEAASGGSASCAAGSGSKPGVRQGSGGSEETRFSKSPMAQGAAAGAALGGKAAATRERKAQAAGREAEQQDGSVTSGSPAPMRLNTTAGSEGAARPSLKRAMEGGAALPAGPLQREQQPQSRVQGSLSPTGLGGARLLLPPSKKQKLPAAAVGAVAAAGASGSKQQQQHLYPGWPASAALPRAGSAQLKDRQARSDGPAYPGPPTGPSLGAAAKVGDLQLLLCLTRRVCSACVSLCLQALCCVADCVMQSDGCPLCVLHAAAVCCLVAATSRPLRPPGAAPGHSRPARRIRCAGAALHSPDGQEEPPDGRGGPPG